MTTTTEDKTRQQTATTEENEQRTQLVVLYGPRQGCPYGDMCSYPGCTCDV